MVWQSSTIPTVSELKHTSQNYKSGLHTFLEHYQSRIVVLAPPESWTRCFVGGNFDLFPKKKQIRNFNRNYFIWFNLFYVIFNLIYSIHPSIHPSIHAAMLLCIHQSIHPCFSASILPCFYAFINPTIHASLLPSLQNNCHSNKKK